MIMGAPTRDVRNEAAKTLPDAVTKLSKHVDDAVAKAVSGKKGK